MRYLQEDLSEDDLLTVTMTDPSGPLNRTTRQFKQELSELLDRLEATPVRGLILRSGRPDFGAGGDVDQIAELAALGAAEVYADSQRIKALFRRIECLPFPVVALLEGMAVGGSMELALACHARFALDDPSIRLGFPETSIGLVPGAGGLVRTLHMIGLEASVPLIVDACLITPAEAARLGLIDGLADSAADLRALAIAFIDASPQPARPWDRRGHRVPGGGLFAAPARHVALQPRIAGLIRDGKRHNLAELITLSALCDAAACGFADGEILESRAFARLALRPEARARIGMRLKDRSVLKRAPSRPAAPVRDMPACVGILGAGMMGAGIAYANALAGLQVRLADTSPALAQRGLQQVQADADRAVRRGQMDAEAARGVVERVQIAGGPEQLAGCELMIEAVFEDFELKRRVLADLERHLPAGGFIASNTSAMSITGIGEALQDPSRFLGLHFFSPVDRMHLVEIVRGAQTAPETLARAHDYVRGLRKQSITVADSHGFFASRVFQKFIYEAAAMIGEGIPAAMVENAALQAGYPAGPLALMDDTSLSLSMQVIAHAAQAARESGQAPENHPGEAVITELVRVHGREGRRAGAGFYDYGPQGRVLWPGLAQIAPRRQVEPLEELSRRLLDAQCCDVLRCLSEGVIASAAEVDTGAIRAIGFPVWTGGPLRLIEAEGAASFLDRMTARAARQGARFALPVANVAALETLLAGARAHDLNTRS